VFSIDPELFPARMSSYFLCSSCRSLTIFDWSASGGFGTRKMFDLSTDRTIELPSRGVVALTPLQFSGERPSIYRVSDTRCVEERNSSK
ncbi:unnamed protein product, partial [Trichogramma brassicae]